MLAYCHSSIAFSPENVVSLLLKEFGKSTDKCDAIHVEKKIAKLFSPFLRDCRLDSRTITMKEMEEEQ